VRAALARAWALAAVPLVSILLALLLGSVLIIASSLATEQRLNLMLPIVAYENLLQGATGLSFLDVAGRDLTFNPSINPEQAGRAVTNSLAAASPLVLAGLAVGVGFKAGLFNIGGTGQVLVGGFAAALVG
jgi:simple sugar transport system permease protein